MQRIQSPPALAMLFDVPVHDLSAGGQSLLQDSRNKSGASASSSEHLKCNLRLKRGGRHLLLGKNGCGKSTLLRAVHAGLPGVPRRLRTFLVDQELALLELQRSALDAVLSADRARQELQAKCRELEQLAEAQKDTAEVESLSLELGAIYEELAQGEDEAVRVQKAQNILSGLGFSPEGMHVLVHTLSGGWRMRVAIAAALFAEPDLLLLDEPTNHLDVQATLWLQDYLLKQLSGNCTVLCVSHERSFINAVLTEMIVFEGKSLVSFAGSLEEFEAAAEQFSKHMQREQEVLAKKKEAAKSALDAHVAREQRSMKNKANNIAHRRYGDAQALFYGSEQSSKVTALHRKLDRVGMEKALDGRRFKASQHGCRLGSVEDNEGDCTGRGFAAAPLFQKADPSIRFTFHEADALGVVGDMPILQMQDVVFQYPGNRKQTLGGINLSISAKARVAIAGANGSGKSTLFNLITGSLDSSSGQVWRHRNLRIGFLTQHNADCLQRVDSTPLEYLEEHFPTRLDADLRALVGSFGIHGSMATQSLSSLSGGQRMRVAFAKICAERPHLLVLDEPTNHLDIYSIDALTEALQRFEGGVILVTHNLSMLKDVAEDLLIMKPDGSLSAVHLPSQPPEVSLADLLRCDSAFVQGPGRHPPDKAARRPLPRGRDKLQEEGAEQSPAVAAEAKPTPSNRAMGVAEKEFLKCAKRMREILRLQEQKALDKSQEEKVKRKEEALQELADALKYLPCDSELPEKNRDLLGLLPVPAG